jgi:hypothetical protein
MKQKKMTEKKEIKHCTQQSCKQEEKLFYPLQLQFDATPVTYG